MSLFPLYNSASHLRCSSYWTTEDPCHPYQHGLNCFCMFTRNQQKMCANTLHFVVLRLHSSLLWARVYRRSAIASQPTGKQTTGTERSQLCYCRTCTLCTAVQWCGLASLPAFKKIKPCPLINPQNNQNLLSALVCFLKRKVESH